MRRLSITLIVAVLVWAAFCLVLRLVNMPVIPGSLQVIVEFALIFVAAVLWLKSIKSGTPQRVENQYRTS